MRGFKGLREVIRIFKNTLSEVNEVFQVFIWVEGGGGKGVKDPLTPFPCTFIICVDCL